MSGTTDTRTGALQVLHSGNFRLLLAGQSLSMLSYGAYLTVLSWYAYEFTGSPGAAGLVLSAVAVATVVSLLVGGALADRWDRRRMMVLSDIGRCLSIGALAFLALTDAASLPLLAVFAAFTGLFDGLFSPAFGGIVPQIMPSALLPSANAVLGMARSVCGICGPLLGGMLYAWVGMGAIFCLTAAAFLIAAATAIALPSQSLSPQHQEDSPRARPLRDIAEGFRYALSVPLLISIPVAAVALLLSEGPTETLMPRLIETHFHSDSSALGALNATFAAGTAFGALLYARLAPRRRRAVIIYSMWTAAHVLCAAIALCPWFSGALVLSAVRGVLSGFGFALWETLLMTVVDRDKLSRVYAMNLFGIKVLMPVGYGLAGWLAQYASAGTLIAVGQLAAAVLMGGLLASRRIRAVH